MKDKLTGLSIHEQAALSGGGSQREPGGKVWRMVFEISQGLSQSDAAVLPGGAFPQMPGLDGAEVHVHASSSNGIGYGPGNALVSTPFYPS